MKIAVHVDSPRVVAHVVVQRITLKSAWLAGLLGTVLVALQVWPVP